MKPNPEHKLRWKILRWSLIGLACLVTVAGFIVTEINWRARRDWLNYQQVSAARGEKLDMSACTPPEVRDTENFFAAPIVAGALKAVQNESSARTPIDFDIYRGDSELWPKHGRNWQRGRLTDLTEWQQYFRNYSKSPAGQTNGFPMTPEPQTPAKDVLLALSVFNPVLEELRAASERPYARMPLDYQDGLEQVGSFLPWLAVQKRSAQFLQLRVLAELQAGQGQAALEDEKLALRLIDTSRNQPFLISHLVRLAMTAIAIQPIYEGLVQHQWNDAQLAELEALLARSDYLADFQTSMRGERSCAINAFEKLRITRQSVSTGPMGTETNSLWWVPSAYFYRNELAFAQMYQQIVIPLVDLTNHTVSVTALNQSEQACKELLNRYWPFTLQALQLFPSVSKSVLRFAMIQTQINLARVACALERYHLAKGDYPKSLDELSPQFVDKLPHDLINGQPLHYQRTDDGKFILYSVGANEKDDGGKVVLGKQDRVDWQAGDWVWKN